MTNIKNVVLVHGAFADGSGWKAVADILKKGWLQGVGSAAFLRRRTPTTKSTRRPQSTLWAALWFWSATVTAGPSSPKPAIIPNVAALVYISAFALDGAGKL